VLVLKNKHFVDFHSRNKVILTKFLDFVMFGTRDIGHNGVKLKKNPISINHHICPIFHAENNSPKLQFNFAHFIGPIFTLCGPTSLDLGYSLELTAFRNGRHFTRHTYFNPGPHCLRTCGTMWPKKTCH
jgi:hypothetical protein